MEFRLKSARSPVAWCLEVHDLVLSKCVAGRDRDWEFAAEALRAGIASSDVLLARIPGLPVGDEARARVEKGLRGLMASEERHPR